MRSSKAARRKEILSCATQLATLVGYKSLTRENVANAANVSDGLVTWYFLTMENLKKEVISFAVENSVISVVMQAVSMQDLSIDQLSEDLRLKISEFIKTA